MSSIHLGFFFLFILSWIALPHELFAYGSAGTSGAAFLEIPTGSRPSGMGEAFTAGTEDVNVMYYNPAGLATLQYPVVSVFHNELIIDSRFENISGAIPFQKGYLGFSSSMFWIPPFGKTNINGDNTGSVDFYNLAESVSFGRAVGPVYLGGTLKYIYQNIDGITTNSVAVDLGIMKQLYMYSPFPTPIRNFTMGLSILNLGTPAKNDPLPRMIRFGMSYMPIKWARINVDLMENMIKSSDLYDFTYGFDESFRINTGCEFNWNEMLFARFGYKFNDAGTYTFGLGFNYAVENVSFAIDTSYSDTGTFGPVYAINVSAKLIPRIITSEDKKRSEKLYQDGIRSYVGDDLESAIQDFKKAREYNPYMKNIDDKIKDIEELRDLKEKNRKYEEDKGKNP